MSFHLSRQGGGQGTRDKGGFSNISTGEVLKILMCTLQNKELSFLHPVDQFIVCYIQGGSSS